MNLRKKRGMGELSPTRHTASVILLIFFFLIGYLVLLPSEDRQEMLDIETPDSSASEINDEDAEFILIKTPGYLSSKGLETEKREMGSLSLYSTAEQESDFLANNVYISRSVFSNDYQEINFRVKDVYELQNLGLFFNVIDSKGDIIVYLNDNFVYKGKGSSFDLPISLPLNELNYNNKLKIMSSSPGINIFGKNFFEIKDVSLVRTDKFVNKKEIKLFNLDKDRIGSNGNLEFYTNCLEVGKTQGIIKIGLNGKNIFAQRIVCDAGKTSIDIRKEYFKEGENELVFEIDKGDYRLEDINLDYKTKAGENPIYYFVVDEEDVYKEFELKLMFGRADDLKRALILINGEEISMVSEEDEWEKDISNYVKSGENYIKIIPKNEFEATHLEIVLVE